MTHLQQIKEFLQKRNFFQCKLENYNRFFAEWEPASMFWPNGRIIIGHWAEKNGDQIPDGVLVIELEDPLSITVLQWGSTSTASTEEDYLWAAQLLETFWERYFLPLVGH